MSSEEKSTDQHLVVALKYRPQAFGQLVGQGHIATALSNAIESNRVGHAYLFTGARGVGKTSSARIFAKCLNCEKGPTKEPCGECDICQAVSAGEDVDVLEIDGASNRGIDEIRQLRSNASVRPSRSKYKIYIIDEVHMLTTQAFNALLKTLEEPPSHVKFIFCTTDPQKIPITVLSRCQRFDFSPVQTDEIAGRLKEIATAEGVEASDDALALLARRANGSMRDSQSLLEQIISFCGTRITIDEVHQLLGTADIGRIAEIAVALSASDAASSMNLIHRGILEGVDAGQMAEQLLGYFRDMMTVRVGCQEDTLLNCTGNDMDQLTSLGEQLGLETILMIVQTLDQTVVRMQSSLHARTLLEVAAVRICNLEKLDSLADLVASLSKGGSGVSKRPATQRPRVAMQQVNAGGPKPDGAKKKDELNGLDAQSASQSDLPNSKNLPESAAHQSVTESATGTLSAESKTGKSELVREYEAIAKANANRNPPAPHSPPAGQANSPIPSTVATASTTASATLGQDNVRGYWDKVVGSLDGIVAEMAAGYEKLELDSANHLIVTLKSGVSRDTCSKPDKREQFETLLRQFTGNSVRVEFRAAPPKRKEEVAPKLTRAQQIRKLHENEFIKQAMSLFDAEITGYREPLPTKKR